MDAVSVALLATLLPACLLIVVLSCLSLYLYLRFRNLGACPTRSPDVPSQAQSVEEPQDLPSWTVPPMPVFPEEEKTFLGQNLQMGWQDRGHNLRSDIDCIFRSWDGTVQRQVNRKGKTYDTEARVAKILEKMGYKDIPPAAFFKLLQSPATRWEILVHLFNTLAFHKASLDGDPQSTLLPFPPDVHNDIRNYIEALRGIQFTPSIATKLRGIPLAIATEQKWCLKNRDNMIKYYAELIIPYCEDHLVGVHSTGESIPTESILRDLNVIVFLRFQMLKSPEQLEFRWQESSENSYVTQPDIYAYAGEDGVLLDEPKLWRKGKIVTILDDGSVLGSFEDEADQPFTWGFPDE